MFLDLVRFTSLADIHGDVSAADAADTLARTVRVSLADNTWLVKLRDDGALVIAERPVDGLRSAASGIEQLHEGSTGLDVRGGIHHGNIVWRHDDVFGARRRPGARRITDRRTGHPRTAPARTRPEHGRGPSAET